MENVDKAGKLFLLWIIFSFLIRGGLGKQELLIGTSDSTIDHLLNFHVLNGMYNLHFKPSPMRTLDILLYVKLYYNAMHFLKNGLSDLIYIKSKTACCIAAWNIFL